MDNNEYNTSFLGTGWGFPPQFCKKRKGVVMTSDEADIEKSLEILLTTRLGERVMRPDFGCDLTGMIFEPLTTTIKTYISDLVETAILYHEPRISLNKVLLVEDKEQGGIVNVVVDYTISATNSRKNYVYPFYIKEGSSIEK